MASSQQLRRQVSCRHLRGRSVARQRLLLLRSRSRMAGPASVEHWPGLAPQRRENLGRTFVAALYSVDYMQRFTSKHRYYSLFLLMVAGMNGVVLAGDLFNLYVMMEIAAVSSYALVAFGCDGRFLEFIPIGITLSLGPSTTSNWALNPATARLSMLRR